VAAAKIGGLLNFDPPQLVRRNKKTG